MDALPEEFDLRAEPEPAEPEPAEPEPEPANQAAFQPSAEPALRLPARPAARPDPLALRAPVPRQTPRYGPTPYRGLPAPVRGALYVAVAVIVGVALGATAPTALRSVGAVAALQPGLLAWYGVRALGFMAYLAVAGSVVYGLLLSTGILDALAHRPVSFALHKDLALGGMVLGTLHGLLLTLDQSYNFTLRAILVPFASPYAAIPVGFGQLAFYGFAIVTASFYVRRRIGQRAWRTLHYLTFLVFAGTTAHGLAAGTDAKSAWAFGIYLVASAAVLFLTVYRIAISVGERRLARSAPAPADPLPAGSARSATPGGLPWPTS